MSESLYELALESLNTYVGKGNCKLSLEKRVELLKAVPKYISYGLECPIHEISSYVLQNAYEQIKKEFDDGIKSIEHNLELGLKPKIRLEDVSYKIREGIYSSHPGLKNKSLSKHFSSARSGKVENKPSLDYYDDRRDQDGQYQGKYGIY
jgi:hypothetical protein